MLSHYALLYVQIVFTTTNWDLKLSKVGGKYSANIPTFD